MTYISLPDKQQHKLSFYLAMEEYVARFIDVEDAFFTWRVVPTVIFGRNQLIENEVNLEYCRQHGIETYRRKSGGGCVYADEGNIMMSFSTKDEDVNLTFNRYVNLVLLALLKMGIEATATGRNDILIDGRKVSGNAFYHLAGHSIVHGTLLYDTQMEHMVGSITPSIEKLASKAVESVRQRVALLKDYTHMTVEEVQEALKNNLCREERILTAAEMAGIEEMEQEYLMPDFIFGHNPRYTVVHNGRIDGVGEISVSLEMKNGIIKKVQLSGDFFATGDIGQHIISPLMGLPLERQRLERALPEDLGHAIRHLNRQDFINLLIN
jgi:lipoic acid synthetase/lipoate-protein ligase A